MEGRRAANGKLVPRNAPRAQDRVGAPTSLERVGQRALNHREERFTNLLSHVKAVADPTVSRFLGSQRIVVLKPPKERNTSQSESYTQTLSVGSLCRAYMDHHGEARGEGATDVLPHAC